MKLLDDKLRAGVQANINVSVPWFLCTSLLYYRDLVSVVSDEAFDWMCHEMLARWEEIKHPHKGLITLDDLVAGTGYALDFKRLPSIIFGAARRMRAEYENG
jgi:hypothetical protein